MATVDKNFKVKHGLVVEGTTATVNGNDILTTANAASANTPNTIVERDSSGNFEAGTINANWVNVGTIVGTRGPSGDDLGLYSGTDMSGIELSATGGIHIFTNGGEKLLLNGLTAADEVATVGYVDTAVNGIILDTDHVTEANNLYFTTERAQDAVGNSVGQGLTYDDASGVIKANINGFAGAIGTHSNGWLEVKVDNTSIDTSGSGNQLRVLTGEGSPVASKTYADNAAANALTSAEAYADGLINDGATANTSTWSSTKIDYQISTAVSNLVDGAPELLNTLNELAAAIADNPNYATDVANLVGTKQDSFTAGNALSFDVVANTSVLNVNVDNLGIGVNQDDQIKVNAGYGITVDTQGVNVDLQSIAGFGLTVGSLGLMVDANLLTGSGLTQDVLGGFAVDTNTIASVDYVNTNFVGFDDLPGQLGDYVPLTQKGANDGVATLDSTGQVPSSQLGNVPAAYITSVGTDPNLSVNSGVLAMSATPNFTEVNFGSGAFVKQVATWVSDTDPVTVTALSWPKSDYKAAKLTVSTMTGGNTQVSEVLIAVDDSGNVAITEYGMVYTANELASITADVSGNDVRLRVTLTGYGQPVITTGTLIQY